MCARLNRYPRTRCGGIFFNIKDFIFFLIPERLHYLGQAAELASRAQSWPAALEEAVLACPAGLEETDLAAC